MSWYYHLAQDKLLWQGISLLPRSRNEARGNCKENYREISKQQWVFFCSCCDPLTINTCITVHVTIIRVNLPNFSAFASLRVDFSFHFSSKFLKFKPLPKKGEHYNYQKRLRFETENYFDLSCFGYNQFLIRVAIRAVIFSAF